MGNSSNPTRKQHVVPKFYLRRFANSDDDLEFYDLQHKKFGPRKKPAGIGYGLYFYSQVTGVADDVGQAVEAFLKRFEDVIAPKYDAICNKIMNYSQLNDDDLDVIALMAANFLLRGHSLRDQLSQIATHLEARMIELWFSHPQAKKQIYNYLGIKNERKLTDEEVERSIAYLKKERIRMPKDNTVHLEMIEEEHKGIFNLFRAKKFRIYLANQKLRFITGDIPLLEMLPSYAIRSPYGWGLVERLHVLPLTSQIVLEFHDPTVLTGKKVIRKLVNDEEVARINARQLSGCKLWCCGYQKTDFHVRSPMTGHTLPVAPQGQRFDESFLGMRVG